MEKASEKIYSIKFRSYSNGLRDTICKENNGKTEYISVGEDPFLIKESDINKYAEYGDGIESLTFVGNMIPENNNKSPIPMTKEQAAEIQKCLYEYGIPLNKTAKCLRSIGYILTNTSWEDVIVYNIEGD